jgi:hypothetical protein
MFDGDQVMLIISPVWIMATLCFQRLYFRT